MEWAQKDATRELDHSPPLWHKPWEQNCFHVESLIL